MEKNICVIYVTASSSEEAKNISHVLLDDNLAACINILGEIESMFRWNNKNVSKKEIGFLVKTTTANVDSVISKVKELHSYDCPCIIKLPVDGGNSEFLKWVSEISLSKK